MQNYADEIRQFVMEHTEDVLKTRVVLSGIHSLIRDLYMMEMCGTGIHTGLYMDFLIWQTDIR